jgi:hypothetical protein
MATPRTRKPCASSSMAASLAADEGCDIAAITAKAPLAMRK